MNYEETKKNIGAAYDLISEKPVDRLDCINRTLKILSVLNGGVAFLNEVATSPHQDEFTQEDLEYIHESFCDSALPLVQMIDYFSKRMEAEAEKYSLAV